MQLTAEVDRIGIRHPDNRHPDNRHSASQDGSLANKPGGVFPDGALLHRPCAARAADGR